MRKPVAVLAGLFILFACLLFPHKAYAASYFNDVPQSHWAAEYINKMKELGFASGDTSGNFGLGKNVTRAEFVTMLANLMKLDAAGYAGPGFSDNNQDAWYFNALNIAKAKAIADGELFRPGDAITREEAAIMLINALGYKSLASRLDNSQVPFSDVTENKGYIEIISGFGIMMGDAGHFSPKSPMTKEQSAVVLIKLNGLLESGLKNVNAFYAISSYSQISFIGGMDSVAFGWCRLETDGGGTWLNASAVDNNEYSIPQGYMEAYEAAEGKSRLLMVAVADSDARNIIANDTLNLSAAKVLSNAVNLGLGESGLVFDGIVLDFETLKGADAAANYVKLIQTIRENVGDKLIYVAVHPKMQAKYTEYYDGYDYRQIGKIADKVILMAHDYNPKLLSAEQMNAGIVMTPGAPIEDVYYALKAITDRDTGVSDKSKIMLQINFAAVQWKRQNGAVINEAPFTPAFDAVQRRISQGASYVFDESYRSPYITFTDEADGTNSIVWFEDAKSVKAKIELARMFGVDNISLWRLGQIPEGAGNTDVYGAVMGER